MACLLCRHQRKVLFLQGIEKKYSVTTDDDGTKEILIDARIASTSLAFYDANGNTVSGGEDIDVTAFTCGEEGEYVLSDCWLLWYHLL